MTTRWQPRHVLGLVALLVGGVISAPVAVSAAAGQLVTIVDASSSATARVTSAGLLRVDPAVAKPVSGRGTVLPTSLRSWNTVIPVTSSTIQLTGLTFSVWQSDTAVWGYDVYQFGAPTSEACRTGSVSTYRYLGRWTATRGQMGVDDFPDPITLKPLDGSSTWCLAVSGVPDPDQGFFSYVNWTGYVTAGSFAPGTATTADGSPRPAQPQQQPAPQD